MNRFSISCVWLLAAGCLACGQSEAATPAAAAKSPEQAQMERAEMLRQAALKVAADREKQRDKLRAVGVASLKRKKLVGPKDKRKIELQFEFHNRGKVDLMLAEGAIVLFDDAGKAVKQIKVPFRQLIKAGKKVKKTGKFPLDPGSDGDQLLGKVPLKRLKLEWRPRLYRLADGTTMQSD